MAYVLTRNAYKSGAALTANVEAYNAPTFTGSPLVVRENSISPAYVVGALYLFFLFSHATEFIDTTGRLHLMILLTTAGGFMALTAGNLPDSFKSKPGLALTAFTLLMIVGMPFSSWRGGSVSNFLDLWWKSFATFFLVSGLIFTLGQIRRSLFTMALATAGILYFAHKALRTFSDGRVSVEYGSLGNSNDLAAALLLCLPLVLYVAMDKRRAAVIRLGFLAMAGFLLITVVKTGSRASLLVVVLIAGIGFFQTSAAKKGMLLALSAMAVVAFPFFVSKDLLIRYSTTFTSEASSGMSDTATSAIESTNARKELVRNAIFLTLHHPVFGVGLGNFSFSSNNIEVAKGNMPLWYTCHNIFLLVSSGTGLPGFAAFLCTLIFTVSILRRIAKASHGVPELEGVKEMASAILMSLIVYISCGLFNTNAYGMQLPALAGLTVALDRITRKALADAEEHRMAHFRSAIPIRPSKFADVSATALSLR